MVRLNLPEYPVKTKYQEGQQLIYDQIRKKYVLLTPEEWVRQHFINYLIDNLGYPRSLIKVESGISVNKLSKRTDIVVYDKEIKPHLLVECKAANVDLNEKAFNQLSIYNRTLKANYLIITNGLKHYCCSMNYVANSYQFQESMPTYAPGA